MPTPTQQLLSQTIYTTDGLTSDWNFSFAGGYLDASHVKAYYTDSLGARTDVLAFTLSGPYQLHTTYVLPAGLMLVIYRDTPKTAPIVDFTDGSGLTELALDTNARQAIMLAAEAADANVNTSTIGAAASAGAAAASRRAKPCPGRRQRRIALQVDDEVGIGGGVAQQPVAQALTRHDLPVAARHATGCALRL